MNRIPLILGGGAFVLAAALSFTVATFAARLIETRTVSEVTDALQLDGMVWVDVSANGLQVFLDGTAPDEAAAFRATTLAGGIVSADRVVNRMDVARAADVEPPRFSLDLLRNDDGIQLIGLVPAESGAEPVADAIEDIADGVDVSNMVETADFPEPETWNAALTYGLRALTELPRSKVTVYEDRVEVQAVSESMEQRARYLARLERGQPHNVQVVLDISAPRPVVTPFAFRFVATADAARLETCAADTLESRDRILTAAQAAGAEGMVTCQVALGVPSTTWGDAVVTALEAVTELGGGTLSFSDADVSLVALEGTDQNDFDRIVGELDADLPDVFSLEAVLPLPDARATGGPSRFTAALSEDGDVRLRGRLPEGPLAASVEAFAVALYGQDHTDLATRSVPDLPELWAVRVMVGLEALSHLVDGRLIVEPDRLEVAGRTGNTETRSDIARLLADELGQSASFDINVTYDEALDPVASQPTPQECVARIQAIQDEGKIVFEPGSVSLTDEAGAILDRIAEVLPDCRHVRMEIAGHTDSQGRPEMNLNLSQARAESVLNGLLARDVLVSNLTAQGYGETQPLVEEDSPENRERNRRIEFRLLSTATTGDTREPRVSYAPPERPETDPRPRPASVEAAAAAAQEEDGG
ncbi:MAG: OmpA family protein [Pseudomonadota bacterium]